MEKITLITLLVLCTLLPFAQCATERNFPFPDDGLLQPWEYYQRYRADEWSTDPAFYQWWYYCIKDLDNNIQFAISYDTLTADGDENEGYYQVFGIVDQSEPNHPVTWQKYEKYSLDVLNVDNYFDVTVQPDANGPALFTLTPLDNDTYHITGVMNTTENVWLTVGCEENLTIQWDLTIHRIYGWYGQAPPLEQIDVDFGKGTILWNTYSHCAEVEGYIIVGDKRYEFTRTQQFRAYGDMNWGNRFPDSLSHPPIEYPWGWYYIGESAADTTNDISVIAGCGLTDIGFPAYSVYGSFIDIRLNSDFHIGAREVVIFDGTSVQQRVVHTSNDGDLVSFNVTRSDWVNITDIFGSASIPLRQTVYIQTETHFVTMDFQSDLGMYNRLLYPYREYFFSDFEALGVKAHLTVQENDQTIVDIWSLNSGVEYGYRCDVQLPSKLTDK